MADIAQIGEVLRKTEVRNRNKTSFACFFVATHIQNFLFRRFPLAGMGMKKIFSFLPRREFIIRNDTGIFAVIPFNDTMTISADYFEADFKDWPGRPSARRVFLDIGANIGRYSVIAAKRFGYSSGLAVEANPITFDFLKKTVALNDIAERVILEQVAVGNSEGMVTIESESHHLGGGSVAHIDSASSTMDIHFSVRLTTMDSLLAKHNIILAHIDFIKIDVEGMEYEVLEGMSHALSSMPNGSCIMIEISSAKPVREILERNGFVSIEQKNSDNLFMKK